MLAVLTVAALGGPSVAFALPSISAVTETAERIGVEMVLASVMLNFAWAIGELVGAPAAAGLSRLTSDTVALLVVAAVILTTLVVVLEDRLIHSAAESAAAEAPPDESAAETGLDGLDSSGACRSPSAESGRSAAMDATARRWQATPARLTGSYQSWWTRLSSVLTHSDGPVRCGLKAGSPRRALAVASRRERNA